MHPSPPKVASSVHGWVHAVGAVASVELGRRLSALTNGLADSDRRGAGQLVACLRCRDLRGIVIRQRARAKRCQHGGLRHG